MSAKTFATPADDRARTDRAWQRTGLAALVPGGELIYLALRSVHHINVIDLFVGMGFALLAAACAGGGSARLRALSARRGEDELALTPSLLILGGTLAITALAIAVLVIIIE